MSANFYFRQIYRFIHLKNKICFFIRSEDGYHWTVQRDFLRDHVGRSDSELNDLHNASDQVLRDLGWPGSDDPFDIRGVVVGHIQSGKTQNFSAVIAKALDEGYRIVIVLSGMHNSLRNQTQKRLMRDLGHPGASVCEGLPGHTGPCTPPSAGLPRSPDDSQWLNWLTKIDPGNDPGGGDFKPGNIDGGILGQGKHIAVVKKEKTRLERLNQFLKGNIPDGVPILVIDDESDQASVDTGLDENDPTTINALIRGFLNELTNKSSYVGYTATPYANYFTDPNVWADEAGASLYPKDFIDLLPEPPGPPEGRYVGLDTLFGDTPLPISRRVSDPEAGSINSPPGHSGSTLADRYWEAWLCPKDMMKRAGSRESSSSTPGTNFSTSFWSRKQIRSASTRTKGSHPGPVCRVTTVSHSGRWTPSARSCWAAPQSRQ